MTIKRKPKSAFLSGNFGDSKMSSLSIHPVEYIKLHLHLETGVGRTRLFSAIFSRIGDVAENATASAVVLMVMSLIVFAFIQIGSATTLTWYYCTSISKIIFTP